MYKAERKKVVRALFLFVDYKRAYVLKQKRRSGSSRRIA
jgi:hypothetical protein